MFSTVTNIPLFFKVFSLLALIFSLLLFIYKNPIHLVLSLILAILFSIVILFMLKVEFLSYIYIMVYVGAIALLFLFIIMMLNLKEEQNKKNSLYLSSIEDKSVFLLIIFKFILFIYFICNYTFSHVLSGNIDYSSTWSKIWYYKIKNSSNVSYLDYSQVNDVLIFKSIYTTYWLHLIVVGFILLVAMIGALNITL